MKLSRAIPMLGASGLAIAELATEPEHIFANPSSPSLSSYKIPTPYESAVQARRILALTPLGTLSTVFPSSSSSGDAANLERRPSGLGGMPIGLMDYIADCEGDGQPTILAINIATSFKNVAAGSNISLGLQWTPPYPPAKRIRSSSSSSPTWLDRLRDLILGPQPPETDDEDEKEPVPYSAANLPRFSLLGFLEPIPATSYPAVSSCFVKTHPDAKYWLPGNAIHESEFVRLVVEQVYWIGGFGDRAYIGWIDAEDWKNVTKEEIEEIRLPGEKKGWKEWSTQRPIDL